MFGAGRARALLRGRCPACCYFLFSLFAPQNVSPGFVLLTRCVTEQFVGTCSSLSTPFSWSFVSCLGSGRSRSCICSEGGQFAQVCPPFSYIYGRGGCSRPGLTWWRPVGHGLRYTASLPPMSMTSPLVFGETKARRRCFARRNSSPFLWLCRLGARS